MFPLYYDIDPSSAMTLDVIDFTFTPSCETFLDFIDKPEEVYPDDKTILCSNRMKDINFLDVIWPKKRYNGDLYEYYGNVVAHLDTGAKVTVTNLNISYTITSHIQNCSSAQYN